MNNYNGWCNRVTWLVNLNLQNHEGYYLRLNACKTPNEVRGLLLDIILELPDRKEILENIGDVNYKDIFDSKD